MTFNLRAAVVTATLMLGVSSYATMALAEDTPPAAAPAATEAPAAAAAPAAEPAPAAPAKKDGKAPKAAKAAKAAKAGAVVVAAPEAGKGQVVFFRPSKFVGMAVGFKVREGTTELCTLSNGRYCIVQIEPGAHTYVVHSEVKDELTLEVETGETYYVQGTLGMGVMVGRPNLSPSDQATFDSMSAKLKADPKAGVVAAPVAAK
jgi:hypothetical protein